VLVALVKVTEKKLFIFGTVMVPPVPVSCKLPLTSPIPTVNDPQASIVLGFIKLSISKENEVPAVRVVLENIVL
jgi:hypothetical protein